MEVQPLYSLIAKIRARALSAPIPEVQPLYSPIAKVCAWVPGAHHGNAATTLTKVRGLAPLDAHHGSPATVLVAHDDSAM